MSCRRCTDHPQEWKILYVSIDRSQRVASHYVRNRTFEPDILIFELTRAPEAFLPLPVNLLSKHFDHVVEKIPYKPEAKDSLNRMSGSAIREPSKA